MALTFGRYVFDPRRHQVLTDGAEIHLSLKAFALLELLLDERPWVVTKSEIHQRVWPGVFVSDSTLNSVVAELRTAFGESAHDPVFIRTVHGVGYAFAGEAADPDAVAGPRAPSIDCWLIAGGCRIQLTEGENTVGRGGDASVSIDDLSVSRRHALMVVRSGRATVEDLGSKNGSFVEGLPIAGPTPLEDGARVQFGTVVLTFRTLDSEASTATAVGQ